ncbi:cation diffusion facilitator family transporter [soil metagenome]
MLKTREISRVLWIALAANWVIAVAKLIIGFMFSNLTVLSDGYHSVLDGANNVVALIAMYYAGQPPDEDHPYGHKKFEHVAAMLIGGMVMLLCWETLKGILARFHPGHAQSVQPVDFLAVAVLVLSSFMNAALAIYERRKGVKYNSMLLKADAAQTMSDVFITGLAVVSYITAGRIWWVDPVLATAVLVFLVRAALSILTDNIATMTDRQRLEPVEVRAIAESVDGVLNAHAIRSHGMPSDIHLDLHIVVSPDDTAAAVARIEKEIQECLKRAFPDVTEINIQHEVEPPPQAEPIWKP